MDVPGELAVMPAAVPSKRPQLDRADLDAECPRPPACRASPVFAHLTLTLPKSRMAQVCFNLSARNNRSVALLAPLLPNPVRIAWANGATRT